MSNHYFATFIPGFSELVKEKVILDISDVKVIRVFESSIYFETAQLYTQVSQKIYFNTVFLVCNFFEISKDQFDGKIVMQLYNKNDLLSILTQSIFKRNSTFRIMVQKGSKLIHIPPKFLKIITQSISESIGWKYSPLKADIECWFLIRNEKVAVFCLKASEVKATEYREVHKGELRPKLAHFLNLLSEPSVDDIYLDPFAGYGALPYDRVQHFPHAQVYASDKDPKLVSYLKNSFKEKKYIIIQQDDALHMKSLADASVTKIVTDPPWGIFQMQDIDFVEFYRNMLAEMIRVVKSRGIIIILTARLAELEEAFTHFKTYVFVEKSFTTLVNGKKATVYKMRKK